MIKFKATENQIKQMCAKAVNAAIPVGMGMLHFDKNQEFKPEDFKSHNNRFSLDYVQGRMTKLQIKKSDEGDDIWTSPDFPPRPEYQSWVNKYPDTSLITDCGGEICS